MAGPSPLLARASKGRPPPLQLTGIPSSAKTRTSSRPQPPRSKYGTKLSKQASSASPSKPGLSLSTIPFRAALKIPLPPRISPAATVTASCDTLSIDADIPELVLPPPFLKERSSSLPAVLFPLRPKAKATRCLTVAAVESPIYKPLILSRRSSESSVARLKSTTRSFSLDATGLAIKAGTHGRQSRGGSVSSDSSQSSIESYDTAATSLDEDGAAEAADLGLRRTEFTCSDVDLQWRRGSV